MRTKVNWQLHNYCTSGCTYCPSRFRNGDFPRSVSEYKQAVNKIIDHYKNLGRDIDWNFTGGEPLEFFDFPEILKICKDNNGTIELTTNGGKLWLDWYAIERNVDTLHLTYHYWQNVNLIKFIIQLYLIKKKAIDVSVPIRPDYFNQDWSRAELIEQEFKINVNKMPLYNEASQVHVLFLYSDEQLEKFFGKPAVPEIRIQMERPVSEVIVEHNKKVIAESPTFFGKKCNLGFNHISIGENGYISASGCGILNCGNIWNDTINLPNGPTICDRNICLSPGDKYIID